MALRVDREGQAAGRGVDSYDAAMDAALISKLTGRPVRQRGSTRHGPLFPLRRMQGAMSYKFRTRLDVIKESERQPVRVKVRLRTSDHHA